MLHNHIVIKKERNHRKNPFRRFEWIYTTWHLYTRTAEYKVVHHIISNWKWMNHGYNTIYLCNEERNVTTEWLWPCSRHWNYDNNKTRLGCRAYRFTSPVERCLDSNQFSGNLKKTSCCNRLLLHTLGVIVPASLWRQTLHKEPVLTVWGKGRILVTWTWQILASRNEVKMTANHVAMILCRFKSNLSHPS